MRRAVDILALASVAALLVFGALAWTRRIDQRASEHYEQQLRSLLALDFRLAAEVMKARAGVVAHYDGIVQTEAARRRLRVGLRNLPNFLRARAPTGIEQYLISGERAQRESDRLVESFKRENAVLRNSLRFLPVLAREVESTTTAGAALQLVASTAALVRDELLLQTWQDATLLARIDQQLRALAATPAPLAAREVLDALVDHARVVRERTPIVQQLTHSILAGDGPRLTQATMSAFERERRAALRIADSDASVCFLLAILALASAAGSIILRLRHSAEDLRRTGVELERAVKSLRIEQAKQRELSELKSRFVSMASHEFRTPLSVIVSSSEMLEAYAERWAVTKRQEHFARIRLAAQGMTRMLDAILMIGQRDAGMLRFEPRSVEIDALCGEVIDAIVGTTGQRRRVIYQGPPANEPVTADPALLRHVLENLLSNALKYSPDDAAVELRVAREHDELRFEVRDHGIGISQEDQRHLFESFHRGKNVGSISGTGLGLAIVHGAVELHGGSVSVQSELEQGTRFTVRIPCARSEACTRSS